MRKLDGLLGKAARSMETKLLFLAKMVLGVDSDDDPSVVASVLQYRMSNHRAGQSTAQKADYCLVHLLRGSAA
jgi:hypothetical protein